MDLDELDSRYSRLRSDLARAYDAPVWDSGYIDRLTDAIAETESALAARVSGSHQAMQRPTGTAYALT